MTPSIDVRPFQLRDLDRILEIEQVSFGRDAWDRELFLEYFRQSPDLFLIARRARKTVGYVITCIASKTGSSDAELVSIAVDPVARRLGVALALLEASTALLRARRIKTWWLMVAIANQPAIRFYEGHGFRRTRRVKGYYAARRDAWRMRRAV